MTDQDRQYMVDVDDPNLAAFLRWHHDAWDRGVFRGMSMYSIIKMTWMAAKNALPTPEYAPSRDILPPAPPPKRSLNPEFELRVRPGEQVRFIEPMSTGFVHQQYTQPATPEGYLPRSGVSTATIPAATQTNEPDPFAKVRWTGPQQAAADSLYPLPEPGDAYKQARGALDTQLMPALGFDTADLPVVGDIEPLSKGFEHTDTVWRRS